jgi:pimeloyl-ACP methyl ester carboxylesterase
VARNAQGIDEARALTRLAFDELGGAARGIGDIQLAVAQRVFTFVGPGGLPARLAYDAITGGVYAALHGGARVAGTAAAAVLPPTRTALSSDPRGAALLAAINGLIGDALEREGSALTAPIAVRVDGEPVPPEPGPLADAFPDATPRLVVFLHGLMETEFAWRLGGRETYGERLARDLGTTPVDVRYNTGRRISQNGRDLCRLLDELAAAWPVEVEEIALVGHSMGGLVARSACHRASADDVPWVGHVRHVVSLGTPHMGAPLEQAVHAASAALAALPETRPFARFLRRRSGGIRDLQHGSLVDADWEGRDPDALRHAACQEVPLLEGVKHCFVSATITRDPRHPVGRVVGDWLVLQDSASGRGRTRRLPFREEDGLHVGGAGHLALLNHPAVYEKLREWLSSP